MVEGLFKRAKAFIGLEEGEDEERGYGQQMDMTSILKGKKEAKGEAGDYEIRYYEPKVYEDSLNVSAHLRAGSPVVINLKHLDPSEGTRLIDFVCGTAYAIDGHMMKIGDSIFMFAPNLIAITQADERSPLEDELGSAEGTRENFFTR